jgi:hypothetical protein
MRKRAAPLPPSAVLDDGVTALVECAAALRLSMRETIGIYMLWWSIRTPAEQAPVEARIAQARQRRVAAGEVGDG